MHTRTVAAGRSVIASEKISRFKERNYRMYIISISHKTAPVNIRELFSFTTKERVEFLKLALSNEHISECVLLSTCNRCEIYFAGDHQAVLILQKLFAEFKGLDLELLLRYFLVYDEDRAINHLFQVTCGMDSMVVGEDEILGQVKDAYNKAHQAGATKYLLNTLFQAAIACAKRIKTDTLISKTPVSIGTLVANEIIHYPKTEKTVLIIGITGKMGSIIMKNLYDKKNINIIGTSRSHNAIGEVCKSYKNIKMVDYQSRYQEVDSADIIISATTSPHYTITYYELAGSIHTDKERLFIDLSVPIDIDKNVVKVNKATLRDIDYFDQASTQNILIKEQETCQARVIIDECLDEIKKELIFREFLQDIPEVSKAVEALSFEKTLYEIKNKANSDELKVLLGLLRKLEQPATESAGRH